MRWPSEYKYERCYSLLPRGPGRGWPNYGANIDLCWPQFWTVKSFPWATVWLILFDYLLFDYNHYVMKYVIFIRLRSPQESVPPRQLAGAL